VNASDRTAIAARDALLDGETTAAEVVERLAPVPLIMVLEDLKNLSEDEDIARVHYDLVMATFAMPRDDLLQFQDVCLAENEARERDFANWLLRCHHMTDERRAAWDAAAATARALIEEAVEIR
jgi:hypothetical protein